MLGWTAGIGLTGAVIGVGTIAGIFWYYGQNIAHVDVAAIRDYRPPQVTRILARDGTVLGEVSKQRRTLIRFDDIPPHVVNAFLAAEDADFYHHEGMDYFGMVRAALTNLEAGELRQGASTITHQVVKKFLLSQDRTFERKIQELLLRGGSSRRCRSTRSSSCTSTTSSSGTGATASRRPVASTSARASARSTSARRPFWQRQRHSIQQSL